MTVLSNVIASALADGKRLSEAEPLWVRVAGADSTEFVKYGEAIYQNGPSVVSTHAVGTQDREITLELIDRYNGGNSGGMKFFLAYKAASNIDGLYLFHDGTSWRLRRFISYLITISDAAFNQGNVRRKCVMRSEGGNVTLSVYDESDVLIGSQTVSSALDTYTGALPVCIYDGTGYSVGDAVTQDGMGYMSIKVADLQTSGDGEAISVSLSGSSGSSGELSVSKRADVSMSGESSSTGEISVTKRVAVSLSGSSGSSGSVHVLKSAKLNLAGESGSTGLISTEPQRSTSLSVSLIGESGSSALIEVHKTASFSAQGSSGSTSGISSGKSVRVQLYGQSGSSGLIRIGALVSFSRAFSATGRLAGTFREPAYIKSKYKTGVVVS